MISLRMDGLDDLRKALNSLSPRISKSIQRDAMAHGAEPMRLRMAQRAPYEPGKPDLRDMMRIGIPRTSGAAAEVEVGPLRGGYYASFNELGTAHQPARPFMRPAFDETKDDVLATIAADLWTALAARGIMRSETSDTNVIGGPGGGLM